MNKRSMNGTWKEMAGKLKQKYATLTNDEMLFIRGKQEELLGRLEQEIGTSRKGLRNMITKL